MTAEWSATGFRDWNGPLLAIGGDIGLDRIMDLIRPLVVPAGDRNAGV